MAIKVTDAAVKKIAELMPDFMCFIRFGVRGGGCSGFSYTMQWEQAEDFKPGPMDKVFEFPPIKVVVDATSLMYLDGCEIDYLETLEASGFKFNNPNVKSTCGCGSSFSA